MAAANSRTIQVDEVTKLVVAPTIFWLSQTNDVNYSNAVRAVMAPFVTPAQLLSTSNTLYSQIGTAVNVTNPTFYGTGTFNGPVNMGPTNTAGKIDLRNASGVTTITLDGADGSVTGVLNGTNLTAGTVNSNAMDAATLSLFAAAGGGVTSDELQAATNAVPGWITTATNGLLARNAGFATNATIHTNLTVSGNLRVNGDSHITYTNGSAWMDIYNGNITLPGAFIGTWNGVGFLGLNTSLTNASGQTISQEILANASNVKLYGAVGDGVTDNTAAIQSGINAMTNGSTLMIPVGEYVITEISLTNKSNVRLVGPGQLTLVGTNSLGYSGIRLAGNCDNVEISGLRIVGDGTTNNSHTGIWGLSGANLRNIRIKDNTISDVTLGISLNANLGGSVYDCEISGNTLSNILGTANNGYGIHHASAVGSGVRILNNTIDGAQRHSIYQGRGTNVIISGNIIRNHRTGVADSTFRSAISVSRSSNVQVSDNQFIGCSDGCVELYSDNTDQQGIEIRGNQFLRQGNATPFVIIGSLDPANEGYPSRVDLHHNLFDANLASDFVRYLDGKDIQIRDNTFVGNTNSGYRMLQLVCQNESAGTNLYCDRVRVTGNSFINTTTNTGVYAVELTAAAAASAAEMIVEGNTYVNALEWVAPGAVVNPYWRPEANRVFKGTTPNIVAQDRQTGYAASESLYYAGLSGAIGELAVWWRWGYMHGDWFLDNNVSGSTNTVIFANWNTGNVGIGTTNPVAKLDVNGTIKTILTNKTALATDANGVIIEGTGTGNASLATNAINATNVYGLVSSVYLPTNSVTVDGIVKRSGAVNSKVWKTGPSGEAPDWRDDYSADPGSGIDAATGTNISVFISARDSIARNGGSGTNVHVWTNLYVDVGNLHVNGDTHITQTNGSAWVDIYNGSIVLPGAFTATWGGVGFLGLDTSVTNAAGLTISQEIAAGTNDLNTALLSKLTAATNNALTLSTNFSLQIGAEATNGALLIGANSTNDVLRIGLAGTNNVLVASNTISLNSTNFTLLMGANGSNDVLRIGANGTNDALRIGLNGTNNVLEASNSISLNSTNFSLLIGESGTNNTLTASNSLRSLALSTTNAYKLRELISSTGITLVTNTTTGAYTISSTGSGMAVAAGTNGIAVETNASVATVHFTGDMAVLDAGDLTATNLFTLLTNVLLMADGDGLLAPWNTNLANGTGLPRSGVAGLESALTYLTNNIGAGTGSSNITDNAWSAEVRNLVVKTNATFEGPATFSGGTSNYFGGAIGVTNVFVKTNLIDSVFYAWVESQSSAGFNSESDVTNALNTPLYFDITGYAGGATNLQYGTGLPRTGVTGLEDALDYFTNNVAGVTAGELVAATNNALVLSTNFSLEIGAAGTNNTLAASNTLYFAIVAATNNSLALSTNFGLLIGANGSNDVLGIGLAATNQIDAVSNVLWTATYNATNGLGHLAYTNVAGTPTENYVLKLIGADKVATWSEDATGGSPTFDQIGNGTAANKAFAIGDASTLGPSGSGVLTANALSGAAVWAVQLGTANLTNWSALSPTTYDDAFVTRDAGYGTNVTVKTNLYVEGNLHLSGSDGTNSITYTNGSAWLRMNNGNILASGALSSDSITNRGLTSQNVIGTDAGGKLIASTSTMVRTGLGVTETPTGSKFLRDDYSWQVPPGGSQTPLAQNVDAAGYSLLSAGGIGVTNTVAAGNGIWTTSGTNLTVSGSVTATGGTSNWLGGVTKIDNLWGSLYHTNIGVFTNHSDVTISSLTAGQHLAWSGTAWTNGAAGGGGGAVTNTKSFVFSAPTASENVTLFYTKHAITIDNIQAHVQGSSPSVTFNIAFAANRNSGSSNLVFSSNQALTSETGTALTANDTGLEAGWIWLVTTATSGTISDGAVTITYY
jgi:hypothetical protein